MMPVNDDNRFLMFGVRVEKMYDTIVSDRSKAHKHTV